MTVFASPAVALPSSSVASDGQLLAEIAAGSDRAALGELAGRYVDFVYAAAVRQMGDRHAAEDVTQAVFLVLAKKAGSVRPAALAAWLHQTTNYAAANARRMARRRRKYEQAAAKPEAVMPAPMPESDPLLSLLDAAIASLGEKDRTAVVERYLRGRDATAIGALLGASPKAAQKRLDRAIVRLRGKLTQHAARAGVKSGGLAGALAAAGPTGGPVAPSTIVANLLATPATATAATSSAMVADGVVRVMSWAKVKFIAAIIASIVCVGVGTEAARQIIVAAQESLPPAGPTVVQVRSASPPVVVHAQLRSGVAIDYLGVAANPSAGTPWFGPDGLPLASRPFASAGTEFGGQAGVVAREFAFETDAVAGDVVDGTPTGLATLRFDGEKSVPQQFGSQLMRAERENGTEVPRRRSVVVPCEPGKPVTIRFALAAGPWTPRIISQANADVNIVAQNDVSRVQLSQPFEDRGQSITLYWQAQFYSNPDKRLVAIDTAGQVHMPQQVDWTYKSPAERAAEPKLDTMVPEMRLNGVQLNDAMNTLAQITGVPVNIDWDGLAKIGIAKTLRLSTYVNRHPLSVWLPMLLQEVHGDRGQADWTVEKGVIKLFAYDWRKPHPIAFGVPGLPLARLARFEVQTREFNEWIEFAGLTPDLGTAAKVAVRTSDDAPSPAAPLPRVAGSVQTLPDGTTVELVALGDTTTRECWRPDGTPMSPPFDYKPEPLPDQFVGPGNRQVWAMIVTRRSDGQLVESRAEPVNATTGAPAARFQQTLTMNKNLYQVIDCSVDAKAAIDWRVSVPSKSPWRASLERGPTGWPATDVARVRLGDAGEALLWGLSAEGSGTSVCAWTPPALGPDYAVTVRYVRPDGRDDSGHSIRAAGADGFRWAHCQDPPDGLQRATIEVTHYDLAATFRRVLLQPTAAGK